MPITSTRKRGFDALKNRINLYFNDFNLFAQNTTTQYDYIVSNPPFFKDSLLSPSTSRNNARHTISLNYETLFSKSTNLLKPKGKIAIIFPYELENYIFSIALFYQFYPIRITRVKGPCKTPDKKNYHRVGKGTGRIQIR